MRTKKILAADLFCGAGGFTTALVRFLESVGIKLDLVVVNHNKTAIATIGKNHPTARHYLEDLHTADPEKLVPEGRLDILLASPTCTYHSRARGGKPTSDQQRMDPMVLLTWCTKLRVVRLVVENVPEFVDWGPIDPRTGKPIKSRRGEYFRAFVAALEAIGYRVEWRIITAADHGDATTRARFFLMARAGRKAITWPAPTHSQDGVADLFGQRKKWRAAREIIDWSDRGRSIFARPVPLKPNTLRRIRAGASKFSGPWAEVFRAAVDQELYRSILYHDAGVARRLSQETKRPKGKRAKIKKPVWLYDARTNASVLVKDGGRGYTGDTWAPFTERPVPLCFETLGARIQRSAEPIAGESDYLIVLRGTGGARSSALPIPGITAGGTHLGLVQPFVFQVNQGNGRYRSFRAVDEPLYTVLTRDTYGLVELSIDPAAAFTNGNRTNNGPRSVSDPIATAVTTTGGGIFIARPQAFLLPQGRNGAPLLADTEPTPTIVRVSRIQLVEPTIVPFVLGQHGGSVPRAVNHPLPTIVQGGAISLSQPYLAVLKGQSYCASIDCPAPAITTRRHLAVIDPFLITVNHVGSPSKRDDRVRLISDPIPTLTSKRGLAFAAAFLTPYYGGNTYRGGIHAMTSPLPTVTTKDRFALVQPFLIPFFGEASEQSPRVHLIDDPLPTITGHGAGGLVEPFIVHHGTGGFAPRTVDHPLTTVTAGGFQHGLASPWLVQIDQSGSWGAGVRPIDQPVATLVTKQNVALAEPFIVVVSHGNDASGNCERRVRPIDEPLQTVAGSGAQFGIVRSTTEGGTGVLVTVDGVACLVDILFRMLRNPELAAAMSFSGEDYSYEFTGTETEITKQIGNAVPVRTARALVAASLLDLIPVAPAERAPRQKGVAA